MKCIQCERTSDEAPLMLFEFKGEQYAICPEHLPILIHQPAKLEDKMPGAGSWHSGKDGHAHH